MKIAIKIQNFFYCWWHLIAYNRKDCSQFWWFLHKDYLLLIFLTYTVAKLFSDGGCAVTAVWLQESHEFDSSALKTEKLWVSMGWLLKKSCMSCIEERCPPFLEQGGRWWRCKNDIRECNSESSYASGMWTAILFVDIFQTNLPVYHLSWIWGRWTKCSASKVEPKSKRRPPHFSFPHLRTNAPYHPSDLRKVDGVDVYLIQGYEPPGTGILYLNFVLCGISYTRGSEKRIKASLANKLIYYFNDNFVGLQRYVQEYFIFIIFFSLVPNIPFSNL